MHLILPHPSSLFVSSLLFRDGEQSDGGAEVLNALANNDIETGVGAEKGGAS